MIVEKNSQYAVFGQPTTPNDGTTEKGFNRIFNDLVKIALFMKQRAYNMYIHSDGVNQSPAQSHDHTHHELSKPILPTPTDAMGEDLRGSNLVAGIA